MGLVRRRMRSKGPDPALQPQLRVPAGSGGVPGPGIQEEAIHPMIQVFQDLKVVRNIHQVFRFNRVAIHQMMEEMEEIQEEIQKEMMVMSPTILIKIVSSIANHPMTQSRVEMMEEEDVEDDTRLLL